MGGQFPGICNFFLFLHCMTNLWIFCLKDEVTLGVAELNQFLFITDYNVFTQRTYGKCKKGGLTLKKNALVLCWEFIVFLKERRKHLQYVHKVPAPVFSIASSLGCGWWREAMLLTRWSWNTGRCLNCYHPCQRNNFMLYITHKKKRKMLPVFRERARSNSRSSATEFLNPSESSYCTMLITSIPSPVDEATNVSSICSDPVTEGGWGQCKFYSCSLIS